jgi:hypothetical protein
MENINISAIFVIILPDFHRPNLTIEVAAYLFELFLSIALLQQYCKQAMEKNSALK